MTAPDVVVRQSHAIDDLAREVASLRRNSNQARDLLELAAHAHAAGNTAVVTEYLDRALTALSRGCA